MSDSKLGRRRFLADLMFAGGALTAAALLAKVAGSAPPVGGSPTPACASPTPAPGADGNVAMPMVKGEAVAPVVRPEPAVPGRMAVPVHKPR